MQRADLTTRTIAGLVDILLIIGLARLPDVFGFLSAAGYILLRDGLLDGRSIGKKFIGLRVMLSENPTHSVTYRESIIRNVPFVISFFLFLIPYAGWIFGPLILGIEFLTALGDNAGMRIGDMLARTYVILQNSASRSTKHRAEQQSDTAQASIIVPRDSQQ